MALCALQITKQIKRKRYALTKELRATVVHLFAQCWAITSVCFWEGTFPWSGNGSKPCRTERVIQVTEQCFALASNLRYESGLRPGF